MSWKSQGGNKNNRNMKSKTVLFSNSNFWERGSGVDIYNLNDGTETRVGIGTSAPFSRLSFGDTSFTNTNIGDNSGNFALCETSTGVNATGIGYYEEFGVTGNLEYTGIKFVVNKDSTTNTMNTTGSKSVKMLLTNDGRLLVNKDPRVETIESNYRIPGIDVSGSIHASQAIILDEYDITQQLTPIPGSIYYDGSNLRYIKKDGSSLTLEVVGGVASEFVSAKWSLAGTTSHGLYKSDANITVFDRYTSQIMSQTPAGQNEYYRNAFGVNGTIVSGVNHEVRDINDAIIQHPTTALLKNRVLSETTIVDISNQGIIAAENNIAINTTRPKALLDIHSSGTVPYISAGVLNEKTDISGGNVTLGFENKNKQDYSIVMGEQNKNFTSKNSMLIGVSNYVGNSTSTDVNNYNVLIGTNNEIEGVDKSFVFGLNHVIKDQTKLSTNNFYFGETNQTEDASFNLLFGRYNRIKKSSDSVLLGYAGRVNNDGINTKNIFTLSSEKKFNERGGENAKPAEGGNVLTINADGDLFTYGKLETDKDFKTSKNIQVGGYISTNDISFNENQIYAGIGNFDTSGVKLTEILSNFYTAIATNSSSGTYYYYCENHPGMGGQIIVSPNNSTNTTEYQIGIVNNGTQNVYTVNGSQQSTITMNIGDTITLTLDAEWVDTHSLRISKTNDGTHNGGEVLTTFVNIVEETLNSGIVPTTTFTPTDNTTIYAFSSGDGFDMGSLYNPITVQSKEVVNIAVTVEDTTGNYYVFNGGSDYDANRKYNLVNGTYTLQNISMQHPIAILNSGKTSDISYSVVDNPANPIIINVAGGSTSEVNGDYYTFTDVSGSAINIGDGTFKFMRGKTYKFQANNISTSHPFKIFMSGAFVNDDINAVNTGITGSTDSITITIPTDHSTTAGDLYYECDVHSSMNKNLSLLYRSVSGTTADDSYDFFYGDVEITVNSDYGNVSVYCYYHGYMGGENLLQYTGDGGTIALTATSVVNIVSGGDIKYIFDGDTVNPPALTAGKSYVFDQSDSTNTGHPLRFSQTNGDQTEYNLTSSGTAGTAGAIVTFNPVDTTPIFAYCTTHGFDMGSYYNNGSTGMTVGNAETVTISVTVANVGGEKFVFDEDQTNAPTITAGKIYVFNQSDSTNTNHPLRFSQTDGDQTLFNTTITGNVGASMKTIFSPIPSGAKFNGIAFSPQLDISSNVRDSSNNIVFSPGVVGSEKNIHGYQNYTVNPRMVGDVDAFHLENSFVGTKRVHTLDLSATNIDLSANLSVDGSGNFGGNLYANTFSSVGGDISGNKFSIVNGDISAVDISVLDISATNIETTANIHAHGDISGNSELKIAGKTTIKDMSAVDVSVNNLDAINKVHVDYVTDAGYTVNKNNFYDKTKSLKIGNSDDGELYFGVVKNVGFPIDSSTFGLIQTGDETIDLLLQTNGGKVGIGLDNTNNELSCELDISGSGAIRVPVGTSNQRPGQSEGVGVAMHGQIRYNTELNMYEGFAGPLGQEGNWNSLGGVVDTDKDTKITVETSNNNENKIKFFTADATNFKMILDETGKLGIGQNYEPRFIVDICSNNVPEYTAMQIPVGTTTLRPTNNITKGIIRYNTTLDTFEGYGAGNKWGSLGGVSDASGTRFTPQDQAGIVDNNMRFFTDGRERMYINPSGLIGIGTNPNYNVDISGSYTSNGNKATTLRVYENNASYGGRIIVQNPDGQANIESNNGQLWMKSYGESGFNSRILLSVYESNRYNTGLYINQYTNVGIGNTDPYYKLDISGTYGTLGYNQPTTLRIYEKSNYHARLTMRNYEGNAWFYTNNGDLTIEANAVSGASSIIFLADDGNSWGERMRITGGGKVGIGTDDPEKGLHIYSNVQDNARLRIESPSSSSGFHPTIELLGGGKQGYIWTDTATGHLEFQSNSGYIFDGTDAIQIPMGTTTERPSSTTKGIIRYNTTLDTFEGYGAGGKWGSLGGVSDASGTKITPQEAAGVVDNIMTFYTDGERRMTIDPEGSVGIGTSDPSNAYILDISGSVNFTGNLYYNGSLYAPSSASTIAPSGGILDFRQTTVPNRARVRIFTPEETGYSAMEFSDGSSGMAQDKAWLLGFNDGTNNPFQIKYRGDGGQFTPTAWHNEGSTIFTLNDLGNVGIGTHDPDYNLHVENSGGTSLEIKNTSSGRADMRINTYNDERTDLLFGNNADYRWSISTRGSTEDYDMRFYSKYNNSWSSRMVIKNDNGNVGIGTTSPSAKLEIHGSGDKTSGANRINKTFDQWHKITITASDFKNATHIETQHDRIYKLNSGLKHADIVISNGKYETNKQNDNGLGIENYRYVWINPHIKINNNAQEFYVNIKLNVLNSGKKVYVAIVGRTEAQDIFASKSALSTDSFTSYNYNVISGSSATGIIEASGFCGNFNSVGGSESESRFDPGSEFMGILILANYSGTNSNVTYLQELEIYSNQEMVQEVESHEIQTWNLSNNKLSLKTQPDYFSSNSFELESNNSLTFQINDKNLLSLNTDNTVNIHGGLKLQGRSFWTDQQLTGTPGSVGFAPYTNPSKTSTELDTNFKYIYRLTTVGTSTDTGASYYVYYFSGAWRLKIIARYGTSSNHCQMSLNGTSLKIYTNHSNAYRIQYTVDRYSTGQYTNDSAPHSFGEYAMWSRLGSNLLYEDGNVGIGTNNPGSYKLYVNGNMHVQGTISYNNEVQTTYNGKLTIENVSQAISLKGNGPSSSPSQPDANGSLYIDFYPNGGTDRHGYFGYPSGHTNTFVLETDSADRPIVFQPNGGGNVGIGLIQSSSSGYNDPEAKLHIESSDYEVLKIKRRSTNPPTITMCGSDTNYSTRIEGGVSSKPFQIITGDNYSFRIDNNGKVGIGTTVPQANLEIYDSETTGQGNGFRITRYNPTDPGVSNGIKIWSYHIGRSDLGNEDASQGFTNGIMYIQHYSTGNLSLCGGGGNVGIGTTSPDDKLTVNGDITILDSNASYGTDIGALKYIHNPGGIKVNVAEIVGVPNTGGYIHRDDGKAYDQAGSLEFKTLGSTTGDELSDFVPQTRMKIDSDGNVGIGTDDPSQALEINGWIARTEHNNGGLCGSYNNIGGNETYTNPIYVIGSGYKPNESDLNNMYGIGYCRTSASFIDATDNGYGLYIAAGGLANIWLSATPGKVSYFNAGNVGIGTTAPEAKLHIKANNNNDFIILDRTSDGNVDQKIYITPSYDGANNTALHINIGANNNIATFVEDGNVGIGNTNPSYTLDVNGSARFTGNLTVQGTLTYNNVTYNNNTYNGEANYINSSGTRIAKFRSEYNGGNGGGAYIEVNNKSGTRCILGADGYGLYNQSTTSLILGNWSGGDLVFLSVGAAGEVLNLKSSGNVGIGTNNPYHKLEISDGLNYPYSSSHNHYKEIGAVLNINTSSWAGAIKIVGSHSHTVGVYDLYNTQSSSWTGNSRTDGATFNRWAHFSYYGDLYFRYYYDSSTTGNSRNVLVLKHDGNVGIGTTNPQEKLHVIGNATISNNLSASNVNGTVIKVGALGHLEIHRDGYDNWADAPGGSNFTGDNANPHIWSQRNNGVDSFDLGGLVIQSRSDHSSAGIYFRTGVGSNGYGSSPHIDMTIKQGNVGIGTTNPAYNLDVSGVINCTGFLMNGEAYSPGVDWEGSGSVGNIYRIAGNVGLGQAPSIDYKLDVKGVARFHGDGGPVLATDNEAAGVYLGARNGEYGTVELVSNENYDTVIDFKDLSDNNSQEKDFLGRIKYNRQTGFDIFTNGSERMRIMANGNVGIGTNNPESALHILGSIHENPTVKGVHMGERGTGDYATILCSNSSSNSCFIDFTYPSASNYRGRIIYRHNVSSEVLRDAFTFHTGGNTSATAPDMIINKDGRVGIGTNDPQQLLHLKKVGAHTNITLECDDNQQDTIEFKDSSLRWAIYKPASSTDLRFYNYSTASNLLVLKQDNKVGIGTNDPEASLSVTSTTSSYSSFQTGVHMGRFHSSGWAFLALSSYQNDGAWIDFGNSSKADRGRIRYHNTDNTFKFSTNGESNVRMVINGSGNVGIGTNDPQAMLHAYRQTSNLNPQLILGKSYIHSSSVGYSEEVIRFETHYDSSSTRYTQCSINYINYNTEGTGQYQHSQRQKTGLGFSTRNGSSVTPNAMVISHTGKVGIGTSNPQAMLHLKSTGDCVIRIEADSDNTGENDNPLIHMTQDGGVAGNLYFKIGMVGDGGEIFTNSLSNSSFLATEEHFQIATDGTARMTIQMDGNVGIGTNDPEAKLQVNGDVRIIGTDNWTYFNHGTQGDVYLRSGTTSGRVYIQDGQKGDTYIGSETIYWDVNAGSWSNDQSATSTTAPGNEFGSIRIGTNPTGPTGGGYAGQQMCKISIRGAYSSSYNNVYTSIFGIYATAHNYDITNRWVFYSNGRSRRNTSYGSINIASDDRIKHNEEIIGDCLHLVRQLVPKKYFKTNDGIIYDYDHNFELNSDGKPIDESGNIADAEIEYGLIAQEVEQIGLNELVYDTDVSYDVSNTVLKSLDYNAIYMYHIKATQEIDKIQREEKEKLEAAEEKIATLESENSTLKTQVSDLQTQLAAVLERLAAAGI